MSFIWDWISGVLNLLGLYKKSAKVLFLGLDNAGKTTLFHMLRDEIMTQQRDPPVELTMGGNRFEVFNIGGNKPPRRVWKNYLPAMDGIVFIVDVADRARLQESALELQSLLTDMRGSECPVVILGNKIDKAGACSEDEIRNIFALHGRTTGRGNIPKSELTSRPIELFMCSILKRQGYEEGIRWLAQYL